MCARCGPSQHRRETGEGRGGRLIVALGCDSYGQSMRSKRQSSATTNRGPISVGQILRQILREAHGRAESSADSAAGCSQRAESATDSFLLIFGWWWGLRARGLGCRRGRRDCDGLRGGRRESVVDRGQVARVLAVHVARRARRAAAPACCRRHRARRARARGTMRSRPAPLRNRARGHLSSPRSRARCRRGSPLIRRRR